MNKKIYFNTSSTVQENQNCTSDTYFLWRLIGCISASLSFTSYLKNKSVHVEDKMIPSVTMPLVFKAFNTY